MTSEITKEAHTKDKILDESLEDIVKTSNLPKPSAHRILNLLVNFGYFNREKADLSSSHKQGVGRNNDFSLHKRP